MKKRWTKEDTDLLKKHYNDSKEDLISLFEDRTWKSINHKIVNLGLPRTKVYNRYSKEEDEILRNNSDLTAFEISKILKGRTVESIIQRFNYLGIEYNKIWSYWSDDEVDVINSNDNIEDMHKRLPNRTVESIYLKAKKIGKRFNDYWSEEELTILKENYGLAVVDSFIHLLPNRSEQAIYLKAYKLGLKSSSRIKGVSDELIIKMYKSGMYSSEIARTLSITPNTVASRLRKNGINPEPKILIGKECSSWRGGVTPENKLARNSLNYIGWRASVFERDKYTCQKCEDSKGGNLHAHHILNFSEHIESRYDINNGITLCEECHSPNVKGSFHNRYGTKGNTLEQLEEFLNKDLTHTKLLLDKNNE